MNASWCPLLIGLFAVLATGPAASQETRPNIVLVLVDDGALMDFGVYGGEARTPNIDALASRGALFTQHRATPFCAPSRAMLLTGLDNHTAGLGTIREVLPEEHLGHEDGQLPIDHGFDRSFIVDASGADHWEKKPYLPYYRTAPWFEDRTPATLPEDFYSSTFIVEKMIEYLKADEGREEPFFAYVAFLAVHLPVQAPKEYADRYTDIYAAGWDAVREARWMRAQALGLVGEGAPLSTRAPTLRAWSTLSPEEQALAARSMAVNAGMLEAMDFELGRLIDHLRATGAYDDTVFVITSDNGPEGGDPWVGVMADWLSLQGYTRNIETLGERRSYVAIGPEWAQAAAGPANLFKFHAGDGGLRVPLIFAGPGVPEAQRVPAFTVMSDVAPTLLDLAGVRKDAPGAIPMSGRSLRPLLAGEATRVYGPDEAVGFETSGQAALFRGNYKLVRNMPPHGDGVWRLYDIAADPGETHDLAATHPELMREMLHEYRLYANRVGVLELSEGYRVEHQILRNNLSKMIGYYWGWLLAGLVALAGASWAMWRGTRKAFRRLAP